MEPVSRDHGLEEVHRLGPAVSLPIALRRRSRLTLHLLRQVSFRLALRLAESRPPDPTEAVLFVPAQHDPAEIAIRDITNQCPQHAFATFLEPCDLFCR